MRLIVEGASTIGSPMADVFAKAQEETDYIHAYDELLSPLLRYSLIEKKRSEHIFNVHRMVQAVQRDRIGQKCRRPFSFLHLSFVQRKRKGQKQCNWVERSVRAVYSTFPNPEYGNWDWCEDLLPHALACLQHSEKWHLQTEETALLFSRCGYYLRQCGLYTEAEPLYKQALEIRQKALPRGHPDIAQSFSNLAALYNNQGRYKEAEPLYKQALEIMIKALVLAHPTTQTVLNNYRAFMSKQRRGEEAEAFLRSLGVTPSGETQ